MVQILALGQGGDWQRALSIFQGLRLRSSLGPGAPGLPGSPEGPGPRTWGAIISVCYGNGQWSETLELWSEMRASGARPDGYLMQKVISACEKVGAWEEADMVRANAKPLLWIILCALHQLQLLVVQL